jgi:RNAse (barnase) inhibitor barstar
MSRTSLDRALAGKGIGLYEWNAEPTGAERIALARFGEVFQVRLKPNANKNEVMDRFAEALELDETFGRNWDALVDVIRDLPDGILVVHDHGLKDEIIEPLVELLRDLVGPSLSAVICRAGRTKEERAAEPRLQPL